jgi:cytochrome P450
MVAVTCYDTVVNIDLLSTSSFANGHPIEQYRWLRENAPVYWHDEPDGPGFWVVTRYDDVRTVSRLPQVYSSWRGGSMLVDPSPSLLAASRLMMLNMDPPEHHRFRLLVQRSFTRTAAESLLDQVDELADAICDDVCELGSCDLVHDIAGQMPSRTIGRLMGIDGDDAVRLYDLTEIMHTTDDSLYSPEVRRGASMEMLEFARTVRRTKLASPTDDLASELVNATIEGDQLSDDEFAWFFLLLVNAGGDTTRNLIASGLSELFARPALLEWIRDDLEARLPLAVDELLRITTPVAHFRRTALHDTELAGVRVSEGDKVTVWYGAANRDESVFDEPDDVRLDRFPNPHVAFGHGGPHLCLGMHVARVEAIAMLRSVLLRLEDIAPSGPSQVMASNFIVGLTHLPVSFSPSPRRGSAV